MKKYIFIFLLSCLASVCWTGCSPDDFTNEGDVVIPPEPDPKPEPEPDPEPVPEPEPVDSLNYDNLAAYDFLKNYVNRDVSPDFRRARSSTLSRCFS